MAGIESTASTEETEFVECGLCYENDELKRLPCSPGHILCVTCLTKDSSETKIIQCPFCKQVTENGIDALPLANSPMDEFRCCDVCRRKSETDKLAQTYCLDCKKRFCKPHHESHSDTLDDHKMIPMSEYLKEYRKMETRHCSEHSGQVYSLACEHCFKVFCNRCSPWKHNCKDGTPHQVTELDDFVRRLIDKIAEKKVWIFDKEETILGIVKELTRAIADWDDDTEEMIQQIHKARDKQIEEITAKYEAIEKRLIELRKNAVTEISQYLDGDIGTKLSKLTIGIRKLDTRVFTQHKVDVANGYKDTERLCDELMQMAVPAYKPSENHVSVSITDKEQDYEVDAEISKWTGSLISTRPLPTSLKLSRKVKVPSYVDSAVHHQQFTYVGLQNMTVARIARGSQNAVKLISLSHYPMGLVIHEDLMYILGFNNDMQQCIQVHDLAGTLIRKWSHGSSSDSLSGKICIVNNEVVVCNKMKKCLTVYSLTGNFIKEISCKNISNSSICMTNALNNSVIVSDCASSSVFRLDIETGNVMWKSHHVSQPQGVTCYREQYVFVTSNSMDSRIWILDIQTGEYLSEMVGESSMISDTRDLNVSEDTLLIPRVTERMVYYYKIV